MPEALITVGVPVYNGATYLRQTLDSILGQTERRIQVVISDNSSEDDTAVICEEYAKRDARIRYVRQIKKISWRDNFRYVLDSATSEFFLWCAADDPLDLQFIESVLAEFKRREEAICIMSDVIDIDQNDVVLGTSILADIRADDVEENWDNYRRRFFRNPTSNIFFCIYGVFKREKLIKAELNFENRVKYDSQSEIQFLAQLALLGPIGSIPNPLKKYRRHTESMYERENIAASMKSQMWSFFNTSHLLLRIIAKSSLPLKQKCILNFTVASTGGRWLTRFICRLPVVLIRRLLN